MVIVTGSPVQPFVEAVLARLRGDTALLTLLARSDGSTSTETVTGHVSHEEALEEPYVVLGRRGRNGDAGAMTLPGSMVSLQIDVFSAHKGPSEAAAIQSRIATLLERHPLRVKGFDLLAGSMTIEFEEVFDETDDDMPDAAQIYHGVQRVVAEIHEVA
jgi:hypothetical protein